MTVFILRVVVQHETQAVYEQSTCFSRFFSFGFRRGLRFQIPGGICSAPLLFCSIFRNFRDSTLARWDDTIQALWAHPCRVGSRTQEQQQCRMRGFVWRLAKELQIGRAQWGCILCTKVFTHSFAWRRFLLLLVRQGDSSSLLKADSSCCGPTDTGSPCAFILQQTLVAQTLQDLSRASFTWTLPNASSGCDHARDMVPCFLESERFSTSVSPSSSSCPRSQTELSLFVTRMKEWYWHHEGLRAGLSQSNCGLRSGIKHPKVSLVLRKATTHTMQSKTSATWRGNQLFLRANQNKERVLWTEWQANAVQASALHAVLHVGFAGGVFRETKHGPVPAEQVCFREAHASEVAIYFDSSRFFSAMSLRTPLDWQQSLKEPLL